MAKLRKMLGRVDDPSIVEMMAVMETQSVRTLANWAMDCTEEKVLPIYEKNCGEGTAFRAALDAARSCLRGERSLKDIKPSLKEAAQLARETEEPVAQAAARALSVACGVVQTPTNALGFTFYMAAALVYDRAGLEEKPGVYDAMAMEELAELLESLRKVAVPDEKEPAKLKWGC